MKVYKDRKTCYQKLCKEKQKEHEERIEYDKSTAIVKEISTLEAKALILKYEWLGTMPTNPWKQFGLYLNDRLVAVECFIRSKPGGLYTLFHYPAICLARGASISYAPIWAGSYLISKSLKILAKEFKVPHFVLAYADWEAGELGHIYQACSWVYLGTQKLPEWETPDGSRRDDKYHRDQAKKLDSNYKINKKLNPKYPKQVWNDLIKKGWKRSSKIRGRYATVVGGSKSQKRKLLKLLEKSKKSYVKTHEIIKI